MSIAKKRPINYNINKPNAFGKLIIKYVKTNKERNLLLSLEGHFLIYDHGKLTLTCLDCNHKCVCCENVVIYETVNDFIMHLETKHGIKCPLKNT